MTFRQRRLIAWIVLLAFAASGAAWLARLDYREKISTDVLDLIPADERDAELMLVRELASEAEARTMLLVLNAADGSPAALEAARQFAAQLERTGAFAEALALGDPAWRDAVGAALIQERFTLLFPTWLRENESPDLAEDVARRLRDFLSQPEALALQDLVPADPLLLLPDALARLKPGLEMLQAGEVGGTMAHLVWAKLAASPLSEAGQRPAFTAIAAAEEVTAVAFPGVTVAYTGVNRFAAESRARIQHEVAWLNIASLAAVLVVAGIFIRRLHRALHLLPVVACAILGAWVATTWAFERVHVIVLVLGALLTGVAIDYGFYLFMQPPRTPQEPYPAKVRRLAKPLLASCLTTVAGFALLLFSELPMIRQLGVYVGAGLLCALAAAVIYFATVRDTFLAARVFGGGGRRGNAWGRSARWTLMLVAVAMMAGIGRVRWQDDIRTLEVPDAAVLAEDARIRAAFGQRQDRAIYLTHAPTLAQAREALHAFERWIGDRAELANLAGLVPTPRARENVLRFLRERPMFATELRRALEAEGFEAEAFEPFFSAYADFAANAATVNVDAAVTRLHESMSGPLKLLLHVRPNQSWFVTIARGAPPDAPPAETRTVSASQLQTLNRLFANYRATALRLSLVGLGIVGVGVVLTYGWRDGARIFAIPSGACLVVFGTLGWLGAPLNLFHLLGAFLGVCLTHNYSIFTATSAYRGEPTPVSVRVSALTTAASFGVLAWSGIPVVRALGITVAAIVVVALTAVELQVLRGLGQRDEGGGGGG